MPKIVFPISLQFDISINRNLRQNKPCWLSMPTDCYVKQKSEPIWVLLTQSGTVRNQAVDARCYFCHVRSKFAKGSNICFVSGNLLHMI